MILNQLVVITNVDFEIICKNIIYKYENNKDTLLPNHCMTYC